MVTVNDFPTNNNILIAEMMVHDLLGDLRLCLRCLFLSLLAPDDPDAPRGEHAPDKRDNIRLCLPLTFSKKINQEGS